MSSAAWVFEQPGGGQHYGCVVEVGPVQASSAASSSGSVTGRRQAKSRQTKAVARPLIAKRPCSKSSMLNLGSPSARTLYGWKPRRTTSTRARVAAAPGSPTIATCVTRADAKSSAPSQTGKARGYRSASRSIWPIARSAASRRRPSPVSSASRRMIAAAVAPPAGVAPSCASFGRTISCSAAMAPLQDVSA